MGGEGLKNIYNERFGTKRSGKKGCALALQHLMNESASCCAFPGTRARSPGLADQHSHMQSSIKSQHPNLDIRRWHAERGPRQHKFGAYGGRAHGDRMMHTGMHIAPLPCLRAAIKTFSCPPQNPREHPFASLILYFFSLLACSTFTVLCVKRKERKKEREYPGIYTTVPWYLLLYI